MGCSPWGCKESHTTEQVTLSLLWEGGVQSIHKVNGEDLGGRGTRCTEHRPAQSKSVGWTLSIHLQDAPHPICL